MLNLATFLAGLQKIAAVGIAAEPEIAAIVKASIAMIHPENQETAKTAYNDLVLDNATGHARLQEKLIAASKK